MITSVGVNLNKCQQFVTACIVKTLAAVIRTHKR
jgi:hypothetical protein